ncbi:hypothetical protein psyc5s11_17460 [Clostridium gelidum]|uniref:DJ-1/PfpI domain-containing protein n=1 Tax=Clostridium gelidum TaxID=704125 RepID=A0ABM7T250_9CLOT|nr:hypothetical protein psyc5s11_17460 [Clostridium gelidum]
MDFPNTEDFQKLSSQIYQNEGIISAVCHGVGALLNIKLDDSHLLIKDKVITGYSNDEEVLAKAMEKIPFTSYVVEDERLITGQNPQSIKNILKSLTIFNKVRHSNDNVYLNNI